MARSGYPDANESQADIVSSHFTDFARRRAGFEVTAEGVAHITDNGYAVEEAESGPVSHQGALTRLMDAAIPIVQSTLERRRSDRQDKDEVRRRFLEMNPREFEEAVANLFRRMDCYSTVKVVGGPRDRGGDVLCYDRLRRLTVVQCKARNSPVRPKEIRELCGTFPDQLVHKRVMVTTNWLTAGAVEEANKANVTCIDRDGLVELATSPQPRL
jgi:HJR/Mrr/RecB family endonuclease